MKVKLLVPICGPMGSFKIGEEVDLSIILAETLLKNKQAELVKEIEILKVEIVTEINSVIEEVKQDIKPLKKGGKK